MITRIITDSNGRKHITNEPLLHQPAQVQEPVSGVVLRDGLPTLLQDKHIKENDKRLYTTPPAAPVPLTDEQKLMCWSRATHDADVEHKTEHQCLMDYGSEIEAAHGITKGQP